MISSSLWITSIWIVDEANEYGSKLISNSIHIGNVYLEHIWSTESERHYTEIPWQCAQSATFLPENYKGIFHVNLFSYSCILSLEVVALLNRGLNTWAGSWFCNFTRCLSWVKSLKFSEPQMRKDENSDLVFHFVNHNRNIDDIYKAGTYKAMISII